MGLKGLGGLKGFRGLKGSISLVHLADLVASTNQPINKLFIVLSLIDLQMKHHLNIAILDLYEGTENQGMRCLYQIIDEFSKNQQIQINTDVFDVRLKSELPGLAYDVYISSGGPGSPLLNELHEWEAHYFKWIKSVLDFNNQAESKNKKKVFFICHSFQLACRFFDIATVKKRKSTSFGVFPVHFIVNHFDAVFNNLPNPFFAVDNRNYQAIEPNLDAIDKMGGTVLAIEKERPHVNLERALMAIRFNQNMIGTQFHPEADVIGMSAYLQKPETKEMIVSNHGIEKWESMITHLNDEDKISFTYKTILPNFLQNAFLVSNQQLMK